MTPFPQSIQITIEFKVEHTPDSPTHLQHVATHYLQSKGVTMCGTVISI